MAIGNRPKVSSDGGGSKNNYGFFNPTTQWQNALSQAAQASANAAKNNTSSGSSGGSYSYGSSYNRGSGSRGGGGSSAAVNAPAASAPVVQTNPYADWLAQQQAVIEAAAAAKRQAAQAAYDRSMNALNSAYSSSKDLLGQNYNSSLGTMQEAYDNGVAGVNRQADKTQNQAYINYMLSKRDLPQMMTAQGINGGAGGPGQQLRQQPQRDRRGTQREPDGPFAEF